MLFFAERQVTARPGRHMKNSSIRGELTFEMLFILLLCLVLGLALFYIIRRSIGIADVP